MRFEVLFYSLLLCSRRQTNHSAVRRLAIFLWLHVCCGRKRTFCAYTYCCCCCSCTVRVEGFSLQNTFANGNIVARKQWKSEPCVCIAKLPLTESNSRWYDLKWRRSQLPTTVWVQQYEWGIPTVPLIRRMTPGQCLWLTLYKKTCWRCVSIVHCVTV